MRKDYSFEHKNRSRKQYALRRIRRATDRLMVADSEVEKTLATHWVYAWASAIGAIHFSLLAEERTGRQPAR